jgi:hypothetical protein
MGATMQLSEAFWEMAERFVAHIHRETGHATIVCDEKGIIRKAYVRQRIGQPHAGSQKILSTPIKEIAISREDELRNPLTKEGLNCAIIIDGNKVATFGISGPLEVVTSVARLASIVMAGWVRQLQQQELLETTALSAGKQITVLNAQLQAAIQSFEQAGQAMIHSVHKASASISNTDQILGVVRKIASETHFLSMNGSIEAGRLGSMGQAFGVVASEMGRLSQNADRSMKSVQQSMEQIRAAITSVESASGQCSSIFSDNVTAMRSVGPLVEHLIGAIQTVEQSFRENMR